MYLIILLMLPLVQSTNYGKPISLLNISQFHFVPNGSFLQFSLSSADLGYHESESLTKISGRINITISNDQENIFNFLVFPPSATLSQQLYKCYMRAAFEGIRYINCSFESFQFSVDGNCTRCTQKAVFSSEVTACLNCSKDFYFNVYSDPDHFPDGPLYEANGTLLMIIDNTKVFEETRGYLEVILGYHIWMSLSQTNENFLEMFTIVVGIILLIMIISGIYLHSRIRAYEKKIKEKKE